MVRALQAFRVVRGWHGPLAWFAVAMLVLTATTALAWAVDDRVLTGMPIWAKPMESALSSTACAVTLAWMTGLLRGRRRRIGWWAGTVLVAASVGEVIVIVGQVVRGRQSHFNAATPLDTTLFSAMGALVAVIHLATLVVGVVLLLTPVGQVGGAASAWAVRLGVLIAVGGLSVGFLMLGETPEQLADPSRALAGAYAVGVADGGPGLPLLGWSTTGGDLRVGHFIGMHALQALPLLAIALASPLPDDGRHDLRRRRSALGADERGRALGDGVDGGVGVGGDR